MKKFFVIIIIILSCSHVEGQVLKIGFRLEPNLMFTEANKSSSFSFSPYGFYLSAIAQPFEGTGLEIRPGFMIGDEYFGGYEFGFFLRWIIPSTRFYICGGINNHSNTFLNSHNSGSGYEKYMLFKGIGIGFQKDSHLSFDFMYYWTDDKVYSYSFILDSSGHHLSRDKKINGILKIGFCLSLEIL